MRHGPDDPGEVADSGMTRREQLAEAATDYVLENGLIDLSLRPLAAALGTSDRMLIYHFGTKESLVVDVLLVANDRAIELVRRLRKSPGPRQAVLDLWSAVGGTPEAFALSHLYVQAAASGLNSMEPYRSRLRETNEQWNAAIRRHLWMSGCDESVLDRVVTLMDAAFFGFVLDQPLDPDPEHRTRQVADLADAITLVAHPISSAGLLNWGG